jgi:hypothetical protein
VPSDAIDGGTLAADDKLQRGGPDDKSFADVDRLKPE